MNKLEKLEDIAALVSIGSVAVGAGIGGIISYIERSDVYLNYGVAIGGILNVLALTFMVSTEVYRKNDKIK